MDNATTKQKAILRYLNKCTAPASAAEIADANQKPYSWAASGLKTMVQSGYVIKNVAGFYEAAK